MDKWEEILRRKTDMGKNASSWWTYLLGVKGRSDDIEKYVSCVTREGAPVVASAGNDQTDVCLFTPAWMPLAITVSATNIDELYISTNNGECVDMLAPGEEVLSAYPGGIKMVKSGSSPCKRCYRCHIEQNSNKSPTRNQTDLRNCDKRNN